MFCPNCGNDVKAELKFCSRCGGRLLKADELDKDGTPGKMLDNVLTTVFLTVLFGLGILVGLAAVLLGNNVEPKLVMIISIFYLAAIFGICYQLLMQVPKLVDAKLRVKETPELISAPELALPPRGTNPLDEFTEPSSITEPTTRTLDEVKIHRKA
jgi:hypothetical protein